MESTTLPIKVVIRTRNKYLPIFRDVQTIEGSANEICDP